MVGKGFGIMVSKQNRTFELGCTGETLLVTVNNGCSKCIMSRQQTITGLTDSSTRILQTMFDIFLQVKFSDISIALQ